MWSLIIVERIYDVLSRKIAYRRVCIICPYLIYVLCGFEWEKSEWVYTLNVNHLNFWIERIGEILFICLLILVALVRFLEWWSHAIYMCKKWRESHVAMAIRLLNPLLSTPKHYAKQIFVLLG